MHKFLVIAIAIILDRLLGESIKYQALHRFAKIAAFVDQSWHGQEELVAIKGSQSNKIVEAMVKIKGLLAVLFLVLPLVAIALLLKGLGQLNFIFDVIFLFLAVGAQSLKQHALAVEQALAKNNIEQARTNVGLMVSRDTRNMSLQDVLVACVESVLQNGNDTLLAPIFWFMILGAPGAVLYRLINTLSVIWNQKNTRHSNFGWAATRFNNLLNFIPACFTALSYILFGQMKSGWQCLLKQGTTSAKFNDVTALAAGAGALNIEIGGDIFEAGQVVKRPKLGLGQPPQLPDILRAYNLVERSMILWLAVIFILGLSHW